MFGHYLPKKLKKQLKEAERSAGTYPRDLRADEPIIELNDWGTAVNDLPPLPQFKAEPPVKPVDLPPEVLRQIMDYRPWFEGESLNITKAISYLMTTDGIMEVRRSKVGVSARLVENVPGLGKLKEGMVLSVPKLPWEIVRQTVAFFRQVSKSKGSCEAFVQYWWNPETTSYTVFVPKQNVGGAHVHVRGEDNYPIDADKMIHVVDCHSHGSSMDAFFSGTDDDDEKAKGDRIYMVIGKVLDDSPQIRIRAVAGNGFLPVNPEDIIEAPTMRLKLTGAIEKGSKGASLIGYAADPFKDAEFPSEWMDRLDDKIDNRLPQIYQPGHNTVYGSFAGRYYGNTTGGRFDQPLSTSERALMDDLSHKPGRRNKPQKRTSQNPPFLPGMAFEDYETSDGKIIRVYANGFSEWIADAKGAEYVGE